MDDFRFLHNVCRDFPLSARYPKGNKPFLYKEKPVATNGKMLVMLHDFNLGGWFPSDEKGEVPDVGLVLDKLITWPPDMKKIGVLGWKEHEPLYEQMECDCDYVGCEDCGKLGVLYFPAAKSFSMLSYNGVDGKFSNDLLYRLSSRTDVRGYITNSFYTHIGLPMGVFQFKGGIAAIMGMTGGTE